MSYFVLSALMRLYPIRGGATSVPR
jgi:hypothetical protein